MNYLTEQKSLLRRRKHRKQAVILFYFQIQAHRQFQFDDLKFAFGLSTMGVSETQNFST